MIYITELKFWDEYENQHVRVKSFVTANNIKDAADKVINYYGEDPIEKLSFEPFSPDDFLEFRVDNPEEEELFEKVRKRIGDEIIW